MQTSNQMPLAVVLCALPERMTGKLEPVSTIDKDVPFLTPKPPHLFDDLGDVPLLEVMDVKLLFVARTRFLRFSLWFVPF